MPASLLVEQKMIFYNKILHSDNIVLRVLCALHRNEAQKLSSVYDIFPGHSSSFDIKRAVWSSYVSSLTVWLIELQFYCFLFFCVYFCHVLLLSFYSSVFLYVLLCTCISTSVLPHGAIKNDDKAVGVDYWILRLAAPCYSQWLLPRYFIYVTSLGYSLACRAWLPSGIEWLTSNS